MTVTRCRQCGHVQVGESDEITSELLAALKELLEDPNYQIAIGGNPQAVRAMLARGAAAIAKAEGRS